MKLIKNGASCDILKSDLHNAIRNGTPLPKGHGRLIDADALQGFANTIIDNYKRIYVEAVDIDLAPTIVEADKEERE